jgi:hypothetical protein
MGVEVGALESRGTEAAPFPFPSLNGVPPLIAHHIT